MFINTVYSSLNPNPDYSASDLVDGDVTASVVSSGKDFDNGSLGNNLLTYSVFDSHGNGATTTRTVNIINAVKPIIYRTGVGSITVEGGSVYNDLGATAIDRDGSNITTSIVTANPVNANVVGNYNITYDVTGAELGTSTGTNIADQANRTVNVVDTTAPTVTLNGASPMILKVGDTYTDPGANSTDNINLPKVLFGVPASVNTGTFGTTTITYSDTDSAGNTSTATRNVIVRNLGLDASLMSLTTSIGNLSPIFTSSVTEYTVELPYGTTELPIVSATVTDSFATSTITQATSITSATSSERTATVVVTSEDKGEGQVQKTYTVVFSIASAPVIISSRSSSGSYLPGFSGVQGSVLGAAIDTDSTSTCVLFKTFLKKGWKDDKK
jgi:hypothetical protein